MSDYDGELDGILHHHAIALMTTKGVPAKQKDAEAKAKLSALLRRVEVEGLNRLPFEHPGNGWCAKTNDEHPAKFKKCARCVVDDRIKELEVEL